MKAKWLSLQALWHTKTVRLFCRPSDIKFDETRPRVLLNVDSHAGICVADLVTLETYEYLGVLSSVDNWCAPGDIKEAQYYVACFVELVGTMQGSKAQLVDTFCVLANEGLVKPADPPVHVIKRAGFFEDDPVALYWVGALKKVARE